MHIDKIITQHRRDFTAEFRCGHCDTVEIKTGYDDAYFHAMVIPAMKCKECGERSDLYEARATMYPEGEVV